MSSKQKDKHWQVIGEQMPYFGVITWDEFKPDVLDKTAIDKFFETGEEHIEKVLAWISHYLTKDFQPARCLDFGCGVGRLVIPLAKRFPEVVGVDISRSMLDEAKRNCDKLGLSNVKFVESDDELSKAEGKFDLIHSIIVLQHIDVHRGEKIFKRMLELLNDGGVGFLHFTYAREDDKRSERIIESLRKKVPLVQGTINLIRGRKFGYPHIPMNEYNMNHLLQMLYEKGFDRTVLNFTKHGRDLGAILMFQKSKNNTPPNF